MDLWTISYWAITALLFGSVIGMVYIDSVAKEKGIALPFNIISVGGEGTILFAGLCSAAWLPIICTVATTAVIWGVGWFIKKVLLANTIDKVILWLLKKRNKDV